MKVAIVGSRNCAKIDKKIILQNIPEACSEIISGGAQGVDTVAQEIAGQLELRMTVFLPEYEKYGAHAPLVRNQQIVERADLVLAFWDFQSRGTADTIAQCIATGTQVRVIGLDAPELGEDAVGENELL